MEEENVDELQPNKLSFLCPNYKKVLKNFNVNNPFQIDQRAELPSYIFCKTFNLSHLVRDT